MTVPPNRLSPEAIAEVHRQARLIAEMGDAWRPTPESVRDVVASVMEAERQGFRRARSAGVAEAKARGVTMGRPRKEKPENFDEVFARWSAGEISRNRAARMLGVHGMTFDRWRREILGQQARSDRNEKVDLFKHSASVQQNNVLHTSDWKICTLFV